MRINKKTFLLFHALIIALAASNVASGVPFDIIVPETVEINSQGGHTGIGATGWGWIIATKESIELNDLENVTFSGSLTDQSLRVFGQAFLNVASISPLNIHEGAGNSTSWNTVFSSLLEKNETIKDIPLWQIGFGFPSNYSGSAIFSGTISLGNDTATYSTNVIFGGFSETIFVTQAQRISSVPIPPAILLFGSGLLGLIGIARRKKTA